MPRNSSNLIPFLLLLAVSCNDAPKKQSATTTPDTTKPSKPPITQANTRISEINDYSGLKKDFMLIRYDDIDDTLYGYSDSLRRTFYVDGDIVMDYPQTGVKGVGTFANLWRMKNDSIVIPYTITPTYPYKDSILKAFAIWQQQVPVKFKPKDPLTIDYVEFAPSANNRTQSYVGRRGGGRQIIELARWANAGHIAHEIGHALGLYHEMSRRDRDSFVIVHCLDDFAYKHAYKKNPYARDIGPYDYYSIMHYPVSSCMSVIAGVSLPPNIPGQRDSISSGDVRAISKIYKLHSR